MLQEFFIEWNEAVGSRIPSDTIKNNNGIIIEQRAHFKFRERSVQMYAKLASGGENIEEAKRQWIIEFFCPSTGKFMTNRKQKSMVSCAMDIMDFVSTTSNRAAKLAIRETKCKQREIQRVVFRYRSRLTTETTLPTDIMDIILDETTPTMSRNRSVWNDNAIEVLIKLHRQILYPEVFIEGTNTDDEQTTSYNTDDVEILNKLHITRMYHIAAAINANGKKDVFGHTIVPTATAKHEFLYKRDNLPYGVRLARLNYAKMFEMLRSPGKMMVVVKILCRIYEHITGVTPAVMYEKVKEFRAQLKNRAMQHDRQRGGQQNAPVAGVAFRPMANTIGVVFGDVLDDIQVAIAKDEKETTATKQPPPADKEEAEVLKSVRKKKNTAAEDDERPLKAKAPKKKATKKTWLPDLNEESDEK